MTEAICQPSRARSNVRSVAAAAAVLLALGLGACGQGNSLNLGLEGDKLKTSDIATSSAGQRPEAELEKATAYWGDQHAKNPRDPKATLSFARNLKAMGRKAQALAVLQSSYVYAPENKEFLSEYGRLALDLGQVSTAGELLARADDPAHPDWRVISARGTVLAKQGRYKEAIDYYERARVLAPDQASVLSNLGMAHTMNGEGARGEELLRQAAALGSVDPRVERNLALVLELQGKPPGNATSAPQMPAAAQVAPAQVAPAVAREFAAASPAKAAAPEIPAPTRAVAWDKPLPMEAAASASSQ